MSEPLAESTWPARFNIAVDGFMEICREYGWDTREGSFGRCWLIAAWFAYYARSCGIPDESITIQQVRNAHPAADDEIFINFVVIDGWEFYFGGRGRLEDPRPWPLIGRLDDLMEEFGSTFITNFCAGCGYKCEGDRGQHPAKQSCPGHLHPYALRDWALDRIDRKRSTIQIRQAAEQATDNARSRRGQTKMDKTILYALRQVEESRVRLWLATYPPGFQIAGGGPLSRSLQPGDHVRVQAGPRILEVDVPLDLRTPSPYWG